MRDEARHDLEVKIRGLRKELNTRLDGMDKAGVLLATDLRAVPSDTDKAMGQLKALHEEKLASLRREIAQRFVDNETAVKAAFAAAKEAVTEQDKSNNLANTKTEAAFTKQIDQLSKLMDQTFKGIEDKINDLGTRANRSELAGGRSEIRVEEHRVTAGNIQAWVGILILAAAAVIGFLASHFH